MQRFTFAVSASALVVAVMTASVADAYLTSFPIPFKCLVGKLKAVGKGTAAFASCNAKDAAKPDPAKLAVCLDKAATKLTSTFAKLDAKYPGGCLAPNGDGPDRLNGVVAFTDQLDADVGSAVGKCDAAKQKCVGKYATAILGCYAKAANGKTTGAVDPDCPAKAATKLADGVKGCLDKAAAAGDCTNGGSQSTMLAASADAFVDQGGCLLAPGAAGCATVPTPTPTPTATATPTTTATPVACPSTIDFVAAPGSQALADWGWTGIGHGIDLASGRSLTVQVVAPIGTDCFFLGPIAASAGTLANQRCSGNTAVHCPNAPGGTGGPCTGLGTCEFYWGPPQPISDGGVSVCMVEQIAGTVAGTVDPASGALGRSLPIEHRFYAPFSNDRPCPRCLGDTVPNNGVASGTCDQGARHGLACDANGSTPAFPDAGATSLDCPPLPANFQTSLIHDVDGSTGISSLVLSSASPACSQSGFTTKRCACDTCNNASHEPCDTNADCPMSGGQPGICGGRRCLNGVNDGAPCNTASICPGGLCGRAGEPTRPSFCIDDTATPGDQAVCVDTAPVGDHRGTCAFGPKDQTCSASSGHPQRGCTTAADCCDDPPGCVMDPVTPGECLLVPRSCFLDNGAIGGAITAVGMADPPSGGVAEPTLAYAYCSDVADPDAYNNILGNPGPVRATLTETMRFHP